MPDSRLIQALIDRLDPQDSRSWPIRVCKEELNALPLWGRGMDLWALRPDGEILCLDMDSVQHAFESETDELILYAVMAHGITAYPELADQVPLRPAEVVTCTSCQGTGDDPADPYCLSCSGMGWVANPRGAKAV